jgi:hypothetical protein
MPTETNCANCRDLEARIKRLEAEIRRLRRKLEVIARCCQQQAARSAGVLNRPSGVPRATYGYHKAAHAVAVMVLKLVR